MACQTCCGSGVEHDLHDRLQQLLLYRHHARHDAECQEGYVVQQTAAISCSQRMDESKESMAGLTSDRELLSNAGSTVGESGDIPFTGVAGAACIGQCVATCDASLVARQRCDTLKVTTRMRSVE